MIKILGCLLAIATLVSGVMSGMTFTQMQRTDGVFEKIGKIEERQKINTEFLSTATASINAINRDIAKVKSNIVSIRERFAQAETDPRQVLARHGIYIAEQFAAAYIGGHIYIFPRTTSAMNILLTKGFKRERFTPVLAGFKLTK